MKLASLALSASMVLGLAAVAEAQSPPQAGAEAPRPAFTPTQTTGPVARYILGPAGHVRGFQLANGAVVWVHGHEGDALAQRVPVGQSVRVEGFVIQGAPTTVIHRPTIQASDGTTLVTAPPMPPGGFRGPREPGGREAGEGHEGHMHGMMEHRLERLEAMPQYSANGTVQTVLQGPRGGIHGLLLANNTAVFFPRPISEGLRAHGVQPGQVVRVNGRGGAFPLGASVLAEQVTLADGTTLSAPLPAAPAAPPPVR